MALEHNLQRRWLTAYVHPFVIIGLNVGDVAHPRSIQRPPIEAPIQYVASNRFIVGRIGSVNKAALVHAAQMLAQHALANLLMANIDP
jgi:hypothetical protein